jgi:hypothetical protein
MDDPSHRSRLLPVLEVIGAMVDRTASPSTCHPEALPESPSWAQSPLLMALQWVNDTTSPPSRVVETSVPLLLPQPPKSVFQDGTRCSFSMVRPQVWVNGSELEEIQPTLVLGQTPSPSTPLDVDRGWWLIRSRFLHYFGTLNFS